MGGSLSKQEQRFVEKNWTELIVEAAEHDAQLQQGNVSINEGSSARRRRPEGFSMSVNEWQAVMCLADEMDPSSIPSLLLSSEGKGREWDLAQAVRCPIAAALCHVVALCEGSVSVAVGQERLMELRLAVSESAIDNERDRVQDSIIGTIFALVQTATQGRDGGLPLPSLLESSLTRSGRKLDAPEKAASSDYQPMEKAIAKLDTLVSAVAQLNNKASPSISHRPILLLSMRTLSACILVTGSLAICEQLISCGHQEALSSCAQSALHRALGLLQVLDEELKSLGLSLDSSSQQHAVSTAAASPAEYSIASSSYIDRSRSIAGSFFVVGRLQLRIQSTLLLLDTVRMKVLPSIPHLLPPRSSSPTTPTTAASSPPPSSLTWDTLPQTYVGNHAVIHDIKKHFSSKARGIVADNKPSVLLFFGPSGHGKTELAKCISKILHPSSSDVEADGKLVVIHLPSFCTKDSIYSLVDPPAAHVGEGMLLSALRRSEDAVVVLDEFEKSTADSIQHLWLSAFQKDGMLRSLKDSSRSVSTCKSTFILTCNLCDQEIHEREVEYLTADAHRQSEMRGEFTEKCKAAVKAQFGEPFLNRIDFVLPFVPYTIQDKRDYVGIQLSKIALKQARQYNRFFIPTPSYVTSVATTTKNFHGSDVTKRVCDMLFTLPEDADPSSQEANTILAHMCPYVCAGTGGRRGVSVSGCSYESALGFAAREADVVALVTAGLVPSKTTGDAVVSREDVERLVGSIISQGLTYQRQLLLGTSTSISESKPSSLPLEPSSSAPAPAIPAVKSSTLSSSDNTSQSSSVIKALSSRDTHQDPMLELMTEVHTDKMVTEKDTSCSLELDTLRQQLLDLAAEKATILATLHKTEKEKETLLNTVKGLEMKVQTLTEKVKQLETVVGMLVMLCLALGSVLALFIGIKAAILLAIFAAAAMSLVVGNVLLLVKAAMRSLYNFLGPARFFGLLSALLGFLAWAMALPPATPCSGGS